MSEKQIVEYKPLPLADLEKMAKSIAASKMFGVNTEDQAMALMLLCQAEGIHPVMALRRYHIIDGKPAYRADALQGEFEQRGAILWHERSDVECSATFFADKKKLDGDATERAKSRYTALKGGKDTANYAAIGELTIVRTLEDAKQKGVAMTWKDGKQVMKHNWSQSPRQMLHARCLTEGVRAIAPGLVAGIYTEDELWDIPADSDRSPEDKDRDAEARVTAATENRTGEIIEAEIIDEITEDNYKDVVCHVGKATGPILGKKVGDLNEHLLRWMQPNYLDKLTPERMTDKDRKLKTALEIAISHLPESPIKEAKKSPGDVINLADTTNWRDVTVPFECRIKGHRLGDIKDGVLKAIKTQLIDKLSKEDAEKYKEFIANYNEACRVTGCLMDKEALVEGLRDRAEDMILTEYQFCKYLREAGAFEKEKELADASEAMLRYVWREWSTVKKTIEDHLTPKPVEKPNKKKKDSRPF